MSHLKILTPRQAPLLYLTLFTLLKWQILQLFAWSYMLLTYSLSVGFTEGFHRTFSGAHPCILCQLRGSGSELELTLWQQLLETPLILSTLLFGILVLCSPKQKIATS